MDCKEIIDNTAVLADKYKEDLRMLLCTAASNCLAEMSFSVLQHVKNCLQSTLTDEHLNYSAHFTIESDITKSLDFDEITNVFVNDKYRRKFM